MRTDAPEDVSPESSDDGASLSIKINGVRVKARGKSALYIITVASMLSYCYLQLI